MSDIDKIDIGERYQQTTKYIRDALPATELDWDGRPDTYKTYGKDKPVVALPEPLRSGGYPFWDTVNFRRSIRKYSPEPLELQELSQLVWACQGVTATFGAHLFRAAPSAGALYPIETYLLVNRIEGLGSGIYHYGVPNHSLTLVSDGKLEAPLAAAALEQRIVARSAVTFIWTAMVERSKWKYGERAYRYIYLDAGHIAENLCLAAISMDLGVCTIGAFFDDEVNHILGVDGIEETVVYMATVGRIAE